MSQLGVILALVFSLIIAIFALANNQPIVVNYLFGKTEVSAIVVILGAAAFGAIIIFLLSMFNQIKTGFHLRALQGERGELLSRMEGLKKERDALQVQLGKMKDAAATAWNNDQHSAPPGFAGGPEAEKNRKKEEKKL